MKPSGRVLTYNFKGPGYENQMQTGIVTISTR